MLSQPCRPSCAETSRAYDSIPPICCVSTPNTDSTDGFISGAKKGVAKRGAEERDARDEQAAMAALDAGEERQRAVQQSDASRPGDQLEPRASAEPVPLHAVRNRQNRNPDQHGAQID